MHNLARYEVQINRTTPNSWRSIYIPIILKYISHVQETKNIGLAFDIDVRIDTSVIECRAAMSCIQQALLKAFTLKRKIRALYQQFSCTLSYISYTQAQHYCLFALQVEPLVILIGLVLTILFLWSYGMNHILTVASLGTTMSIQQRQLINIKILMLLWLMFVLKCIISNL